MAEHEQCADCGSLFTPARADAVYCSSACRQRAYRNRLRPRPIRNTPPAAPTVTDDVDALRAEVDRLVGELAAVHDTLRRIHQSWLWPGSDFVGWRGGTFCASKATVDARMVPKNLTVIEQPRAEGRYTHQTVLDAVHEDITEVLGDINLAVEARDAYAALSPQEKRELTAAQEGGDGDPVWWR